MQRRKIKWHAYVACIIAGAAIWGVCSMTKPGDEVVLTLGEPYQQVRRQSRSTLPTATEENSISLSVTRPAVLRFNDPQYGFTTPAAKFLSLYANQHGDVSIVTLSPQVETLPLDQAMAIVLDLQEQLRQHGWRPILGSRFPPISNTPQMIERIRRGDDPQTFWQVAGRLDLAIDIRRYMHENRPNDERYLITLRLSGPPLMEDYRNDN